MKYSTIYSNVSSNKPGRIVISGSVGNVINVVLHTADETIDIMDMISSKLTSGQKMLLGMSLLNKSFIAPMTMIRPIIMETYLDVLSSKGYLLEKGFEISFVKLYTEIATMLDMSRGSESKHNRVFNGDMVIELLTEHNDDTISDKLLKTAGIELPTCVDEYEDLAKLDLPHLIEVAKEEPNNMYTIYAMLVSELQMADDVVKMCIDENNLFEDIFLYVYLKVSNGAETN